MSGRALAIAIGFAAVAIHPAGSAAAGICHDQGGQYADTRTCVTSVLPSQGRNSYGPDRMAGAGEGAWCEGVPGSGIGQSVIVHQQPEQTIGSMVFVNGYAKTAQTYRANGRVKQARIETSGGYARTVTLKDTGEMVAIKMPPSNVSWVRLTIIDVYPGDRHTDTCIGKFYFNHEEFGALEEERQ